MHTRAPLVVLDIGRDMSRGQRTWTIRSPIAASTEAAIVEIFDSYSTAPTLGRLSRPVLAGAAIVQNTGRPGTSHPDGRFYLRIADDARATR
jgi:hypothetical protein